MRRINGSSKIENIFKKSTKTPDGTIEYSNNENYRGKYIFRSNDFSFLYGSVPDYCRIGLWKVIDEYKYYL